MARPCITYYTKCGEGIEAGKRVRMYGMDFHRKCYTCLHVVEGNVPVLFAYMDEGDLILHCGEGHEWEAEPPQVVGIGHLIQKDASIKAVLSLKDGLEMERKSKADDWETRATPPSGD